MSVTEPSGPAWWSRVRETFRAPSVMFSVIWQVFLIYPILAVLTADASTPRTVLGLVAIVVFSVTYLLAFASPAVTVDFPLHLRRHGTDDATDAEPAGPSAPPGLGYLAALTACVLATMPAGGSGAAVAFLPFLACFVTAAWSLRRSIPVSLVLIGCGLVTAYMFGEWGFLIPTLLVAPVVMSMAGTRISVGISVREAHYRRALGVVEERERVARDLHDVLGHTLTALTIRAQLAQARLDSDPEAARVELANIEELTRTALREMRQTVSGMRAADPDTELTHLSGTLISAGIDLVVVGSSSLVPDSHGELVAWTVREAGTNVVRHSGAGRVTVEFTRRGVRITDDGVGVDTRRSGRADVVADRPASSPASAPTSGGQGLRGLAARAAAVGANLTVGNGNGNDNGDGSSGSPGTVVDLRWAS